MSANGEITVAIGGHSNTFNGVIMQVIKYNFPMYGDERGQLVVLEELKDIPFKIKRVYYIYNIPEESVRGCHAHKSLEQILICIRGNCKIRLNNGTEEKIILLEKPYEGLYISSLIWREVFDFFPDTIVMVLASELYNEQDYIRNYDEFLRFKNMNIL